MASQQCPQKKAAILGWKQRQVNGSATPVRVDGAAAPVRFLGRSVQVSKYSMAVVIFAVFSTIAETEQYFSCDRRTASSTALGETFPPTR
jgi:hypothetical protein